MARRHQGPDRRGRKSLATSAARASQLHHTRACTRSSPGRLAVSDSGRRLTCRSTPNRSTPNRSTLGRSTLGRSRWIAGVRRSPRSGNACGCGLPGRRSRVQVKKPVDVGFLDFSSRERRLAVCRREVELNRRLAPDVYLGVADVTGPDGSVCDHLVVMRRMPDQRRLSALIRRGEAVDDIVRRLARVVAAFHATAARGPHISAEGTRDAIRGRGWRASTRSVPWARPS